MDPFFPGQRATSEQLGPDLTNASPVDYPGEELDADNLNRMKAELAASLQVAPLAIVVFTITSTPSAVVIAARGISDLTKIGVVRVGAGQANVTFDPSLGIFGVAAIANGNNGQSAEVDFIGPTNVFDVLALADGTFTLVVW